ncbi:MAG TPA: PSD1 and planctomycete cytochrome C domain-containing protein, partial [Gemmataceae bacterium]|nr:PSD1 and planctomycete cytochrome C domain-containing protein [Gemmataceae bacterium]
MPRTAALLAILLSAPAGRAADVDFTRDVRPVLSRHCFKCHGPDDKARKGKLRLDVRADAIRKAVVPGKPDDSELVRRLFADEDEVMPPPAAKNPLTDAEKQTLKRWVASGAAYQEHWAFAAPKQAPLPQVRQADWPRNAIDYFVLARLEAKGLRPSPPADRYALVRRLYLDLIGLPPTPEEADAFVRDGSPGAYERVVERLLASPHYGERWARRWLDLARYADTNGYEKDRPRSIWPYRDWVIRALNADLPFDRFSVEQLAGDLLPGATLDQRVATGFHRNTMLNEEGGIDPLEFRFHAMTDRVATTATVWLGLTLGCAQCHTHKYDPIPHREYYAVMAFLNNADEPEIDVPSPALAARRAEVEKQAAAREADLAKRFPAGELNRKFDEWLARESARAVRWRVLRPAEAKGNVPLLSVLDDSSVLASGDMSKRDVYDLTFRGDFRGVTALRLEVLPDERLPRRGPGRVYYEGPFGDFFLSELTLSAGGRPAKFAGASQSFGTKASAAIDGDPLTGWSINGGQGRPHAAVFTLAAPLGDERELSLRLLFERYYAAGLGRFRVSVTSDPRKVEANGAPAEVEELLLVPAARRIPAQRERLLRHFLSVAPELAGEREAIKKLRAQAPAYPTTLVLAERPANNPRPTFRHHRGEFLQPKERVEPGVLSALPPLPPGEPHNRLTFARWLVDPQNPLVGRVTMNRQWAAFFGRGLVRTAEDFGYTGDPPTHPELLDWLAVDFVGRGWSLKAMHRLIVTSATYRQSARVTPELLARDPENRLLARGPRFRLEAELLRDAALRASGLLSPRLGGPSVFPPQPPGVTTEGAYGALAWKPSAGPDRYRRGLYTFSKRTAPFAAFTTFDAPSGEACVARREASNTPLQALTLLNDVA